MFQPLDAHVLRAGIDLYLNEPEWIHGPYVIPLLSWLSRRDPPWPESPVPDGAFNHLVWALRGWSAFRGGGRHDEKIAKPREHLPVLIGGVQAARGGYRRPPAR